MNQDLLWIEQLKFNEQGLIPAIAQDDLGIMIAAVIAGVIINGILYGWE